MSAGGKVRAWQSMAASDVDVFMWWPVSEPAPKGIPLLLHRRDWGEPLIGYYDAPNLRWLPLYPGSVESPIYPQFWAMIAELPPETKRAAA